MSSAIVEIRNKDHQTIIDALSIRMKLPVEVVVEAILEQGIIFLAVYDEPDETIVKGFQNAKKVSPEIAQWAKFIKDQYKKG